MGNVAQGAKDNENTTADVRRQLLPNIIDPEDADTDSGILPSSAVCLARAVLSPSPHTKILRPRGIASIISGAGQLI